MDFPYHFASVNLQDAMDSGRKEDACLLHDYAHLGDSSADGPYLGLMIEQDLVEAARAVDSTRVAVGRSLHKEAVRPSPSRDALLAMAGLPPCNILVPVLDKEGVQGRKPSLLHGEVGAYHEALPAAGRHRSLMPVAQKRPQPEAAQSC